MSYGDKSDRGFNTHRINGSLPTYHDLARSLAEGPTQGRPEVEYGQWEGGQLAKVRYDALEPRDRESAGREAHSYGFHGHDPYAGQAYYGEAAAQYGHGQASGATSASGYFPSATVVREAMHHNLPPPALPSAPHVPAVPPALQLPTSSSTTAQRPLEAFAQSPAVAVPGADAVIRKRANIPPHAPVSLWSLPDFEPGVRPTIPLPVLCQVAIYSSERKRLTLQEICRAIEERYPYFVGPSSAWKRSIRHALSLQQVFRHIGRPVQESGKGGYWTLDYSNGEGYKRERKRRGVGDGDADEGSDGNEGDGDTDVGSEGGGSSQVPAPAPLLPQHGGLPEYAPPLRRGLRVDTLHNAPSPPPLSSADSQSPRSPRVSPYPLPSLQHHSSYPALHRQVLGDPYAGGRRDYTPGTRTPLVTSRSATPTEFQQHSLGYFPPPPSQNAPEQPYHGQAPPDPRRLRAYASTQFTETESQRWYEPGGAERSS